MLVSTKKNPLNVMLVGWVSFSNPNYRSHPHSFFDQACLTLNHALLLSEKRRFQLKIKISGFFLF